MRARFIVALGLIFGLLSAARAQAPAGVNVDALMAARAAPKLADYRLFRDAGARAPNAGVTPYDLNTALYSDGALKFRYAFIPPGTQARYRDPDVFDFPVGAVLIKTFAIAPDMRTPGEELRFLETRLLIRQAEGWTARAYVWNAEQNEAFYAPLGARVPVRFTDEAGEAVALDWAVPNRNQCKGCHDRAGELTPVGPTARNLNRAVSYGAGEETDQLTHWIDAQMLSGAPPEIPRAPAAHDPQSGSLEARARAYLDVNCANCHNPEGPAHTSGLDLRARVADPHAWGVRKRPVAAGRGSAGFDFAIEPGRPERSILLLRMESTDPGVMMPELGRQRLDARAVALVREWIAAMDDQGRVGE